MKILAIFHSKIFCKNQGNFSDKMLTEKKIALYPLSQHLFLMVHCVGKMILVSNQLSQRGATEIVQFSLVGSEPMRETRLNGTKCF